MSRPIKPTPRLNVEESIKFLNELVINSKKKCFPVPTPNIDKAIKKIMQDLEISIDNTEN